MESEGQNYTLVIEKDGTGELKGWSEKWIIGCYLSAVIHKFVNVWNDSGVAIA